MNSVDSMEVQIRATHRRVLAVGGVLPILLAGIATFLMLSWLPQLPHPIAVHWSGAEADGFGPPVPFIVTPFIIAVVFSTFAVAMSWRTAPSGGLLYNQKILLTTSVWLSALLSIGFAGSIAVQRGLADATDAPEINLFLLIGAVAGLVLAAGGWFVLPKGESSAGETGHQPKAVDLHGDERLSWSHTARLGNGALALVGISLAVAIGVAVFASLASSASSAIAIVVLVFVSGLVVTNTWWRVSADHRGFTVRGALGWPSKRIPLHDIRTVQVVDVAPTRDFGGYGWRWTTEARSGVILHAGIGIEVTASSGKRFVVTVDDAETGAGVIAALLTQRVTR